MIPTTWLPEVDNTNAEAVDHPLPIPYVGTYIDTSRRGIPATIISVLDGSFATALLVSFRTFTAKLIQTGVYGLGLMDRIE